MSDDKVDTHGRKYAPVLVAVVGAFLGSSGTIAVYLGTPLAEEIARPDPYTGTQGAALEQRVSRVEREIETHEERHPSESLQFDRRIATLEAQYAIILSNQARILDRLDNL